MARGEKADFIIREDYGYGKAGSAPKIPGGATLKFEVRADQLQYFGRYLNKHWYSNFKVDCSSGGTVRLGWRGYFS